MNKALSEPTHRKAFRDNYLAAKKGVAALILSALLCLSANAQQVRVPSPGVFGDIIPPTTVFDPGNFTAVGGATFDTTGSGGFVNLGGGSGTFGKYITLSNWITNLPDWTVECNLKITSTIGGSNFGPRIGLISQNTGFAYDVIAVLSTAASPAQQAIYNSSGTALVAFANVFTLSINDIVKIVGHFHDSTFSVTMTNLTTSAVGTTINYTWTSSSGTAPFMPNASKFAIYEAGGTQQLQFLHVYSTTPTHPNLLVGGASIAQGYRAADWAHSYGRLLSARPGYGSVVIWAGGSQDMIQTKSMFPELRRIAPQQIVFSDLGLNDLLHSRTMTQIARDIDSIYNFCITAGITPWFTLTPQDSTTGSGSHAGINGATAIHNYLNSTYSANYINAYATMATSNVLKAGMNAGEGVHINSNGHIDLDSLIAAKLIFKNTSGRKADIQNTDVNYQVWNNAILSAIDIHPKSGTLPFYQNEFTMYPSIFQMNGVQGGVSLWGTRFTPVSIAAFTVTNNSASNFGMAFNGSNGGYAHIDRTYGVPTWGESAVGGIRFFYSITGSRYAYGLDSLGRTAMGNSAQAITNYIAYQNYPSNVTGTSIAPIRFNQASAGGTPAILTAPVSYVFEGDDQNVYYTNATPTRYVLSKTLVASAVLDFPSTGSTAVADLTVSVTGAAVGDKVALGVPNASQTTTGSFMAWVSATNTVTIRYSPKATEDPASGTFKVSVIKD